MFRLTVILCGHLISGFADGNTTDMLTILIEESDSSHFWRLLRFNPEANELTSLILVLSDVKEILWWWLTAGWSVHREDCCC